MPKRNSRTSGRSGRIALPQFNSALGEFLALPAHLQQSYTDVVTQVYPLKASVARIQKLCNSYLNSEEDPQLRFEAAVPWVFMQVCDYGEIASNTRNIGWFSQHELAFGVPIKWYKKEKGKWLFIDWAMVFPFIFVDNPLSMSGGREIYGWSKAGIKIDAAPAIFEPANLRRLVSISLVTSGTNGDPGSSEEFLQIFQRRPFLSVKSAISDVLTAVPRLIADSITAASSLLGTTSSLASGSSDPDLQSLQQVITRFYGQLNLLTPDSLLTPAEEGMSQQEPVSTLNIVTLKQFRDVSDSTKACFQGIVGSSMGIERISDGGYLFDPFSGDISGGIEINLLDTEAQPIVETLGIETSGNSRVGNKAASMVRPLTPFWLKMDLSYGLADYQCWRTKTTGWTLGDKLRHKRPREIPYLTIGSGASEEIGGPYRFPRITLRVMPLRAKRAKLQKLIDSYLKNAFFKFDVTGKIRDKDGTHSVVCLVASNFEKMSAATNPGNEYSDCELTFAVPVLWWERGKAPIKHPALIPVCTFAGADWNAVTSYEVYGQLALKSDLVNAEHSWLGDPSGPSDNLLLSVKTEFFPALEKSQEAQKLTVLEVFGSSEAPSDPSIATYLDQLGLDHFWSGDRFHSIALKQVRDAEDAELADYQAVVGLGRQFTRRGIRRGPAAGMLAPLSVKVHEYPTLPIVETLGLVADRPDRRGPYPVYSLKPVDPFWISGAMDGDAGLEMCRRVGTDWARNPIFDASGPKR